MSYRGQRRDNSSGGYGGGGGGRRQSYGSGNQVNPWQGGVVPGGNQMGGLGLLPTPSQSGVLSQLSSPEAQLAMATNLLNKILSPQNQSSNVPSLLSLPGPMNRSYNDYSRGSYADRHRDRAGDRRVQPYSKSGLNRRGDAKSHLGKSRSSDKSSSRPKKRDSDDKSKDGDKQNGDSSVEDDKRADGDKKDEDGDDNSVLGAKYAGIPNALLSCHVCHKKMWDACSFEKHVTGRRHQMMMEQLDESYKLKVELLRHEQRADESQRELEIERLELQGKKIFNNKRQYCTMCDLHFYGNLISHRNKDRHQKLKAFLHPKCYLCHKEFPNRLEWDDHKLSAGHLMKVADYYRTTKPGVKDEEMEENDTESIDGDIFDEFVDDFHFRRDRKDIDFSEFPAEVEEYNPDTPLGTNYVVEVQGHFCKLCNKFIIDDEEAHLHIKTLTHYKNFAAVSKMKVKAEKEKEAAEKAAELKAKREESRKKEKKSKDGDEDAVNVKEENSEDEGGQGENEEKMEVDGNAEDKTIKKEKVEDGPAEVKTEEEDEDEEEKSADEDAPTRGRGKGVRGRGKGRRGK